MKPNNLIEKDIHHLVSGDFQSHFRDKKILITGASGLMGTYFTSLFQLFNRDFSGGAKLFLLSRSNDYPIAISKESTRLSLDLSGRLDFSDLPKVDFVIHCAGHAQPTLFQKSPISTLSINSTATLALLERVASSGVFLFLSSSEVYSGLKTTPYKEIYMGQTGPDHPRSAYIESKRFGEAIVCNSDLDFPEISTFAARLSLAYGPGVRVSDTRVLNQFIYKALKFGSIEMLDSGSSLRTYCYVSDAIEMCLRIMMVGKDKIYNVGGESRVSILELARNICRKTGASLSWPEDTQSGQLGAPTDVILDLEKIKSLSSKNSFVTLEEGLDRTIEWFRDNLA